MINPVVLSFIFNEICFFLAKSLNSLLISKTKSPMDQLKMEYFKPAFEENIKTAKAEIEQIVSSTEEPNLKNTIEALD